MLTGLRSHDLTCVSILQEEMRLRKEIEKVRISACAHVRMVFTLYVHVSSVQLHRACMRVYGLCVRAHVCACVVCLHPGIYMRIDNVCPAYLYQCVRAREMCTCMCICVYRVFQKSRSSVCICFRKVSRACVHVCN